jgi:hypothetical protein
MEVVKVTFVENEKLKQIKTSQLYHDSEALEIDTAPDFKKKLESAIVLASSKHTFECTVTGTQPFEIKWFKNGIEIDTLAANISSSFNETLGLLQLIIHNTQLSDNALFSCRVVNDLGMAETNAFLKVKGTDTGVFYLGAYF